MKIFEHYHDGQLIQYELKHTRRKTLGLYVYPDRRVQLRVPHRVRSQLIEQYLCKSGAWIIQQLDQLQDAPIALAAKFVAGSTHYFRGKPYVLEVQQGRPQRVEVQGEVLQLYSLDADDELRTKTI